MEKRSPREKLLGEEIHITTIGEVFSVRSLKVTPTIIYLLLF